MRKIISILIIISPFICRGQEQLQDSLLLIKKGELQWLLEVYKEDEVLKKRVVIKNQEIVKLKQDVDTLHKEIKHYKKLDSLHIQKEIVLSQEAFDEKKKGVVYQADNRRLTRQNRGLKVLLVILGGVTLYEGAKK